MKVLQSKQSAKFKLFLVGVLALAYPLTKLTASHLLPFPSSSKFERFQSEMVKVAGDRGGWGSIHTVMASCQGSKDVSNHLIDRGRHDEFDSETVIIVDGKKGDEIKFKKAGYDTLFASSGELSERFALQAIPGLVIVGPDHRIAYTGGYFEKPTHKKALDLKIIKSLKAGTRVSALPLIDCVLPK